MDLAHLTRVQVTGIFPIVSITGYDADGQPIYQPIADALASIEAERAQAVRDADAFGAAVSCFARRGATA